MSGIFITGTDTDVGKTAISAGLAGALRLMEYSVGVMKPVQSGAAIRNGKLYSQDAELLKMAADTQDEDELICPVLLREALAPGIAAEMEGKSIDLDLILKSYRELRRRHDIVIVEGAGGIAVPVKDRFLVSDLILLLGLPVIIVARPGLGTINHTVLTIEYARKCGIHVIGMIISNYHGGLAEETNPGIISSLTSIPILGIIPNDPKICTECGELGDIISLVQSHIDIEAIIGVKK